MFTLSKGVKNSFSDIRTALNGWKWMEMDENATGRKLIREHSNDSESLRMVRNDLERFGMAKNGLGIYEDEFGIVENEFEMTGNGLAKDSE